MNEFMWTEKFACVQDEIGMKNLSTEWPISSPNLLGTTEYFTELSEPGFLCALEVDLIQSPSTAIKEEIKKSFSWDHNKCLKQKGLKQSAALSSKFLVQTLDFKSSLLHVHTVPLHFLFISTLIFPGDCCAVHSVISILRKLVISDYLYS